MTVLMNKSEWNDIAEACLSPILGEDIETIKSYIASGNTELFHVEHDDSKGYVLIRNEVYSNREEIVVIGAASYNGKNIFIPTLKALMQIADDEGKALRCHSDIAAIWRIYESVGLQLQEKVYCYGK